MQPFFTLSIPLLMIALSFSMSARGNSLTLQQAINLARIHSPALKKQQAAFAGQVDLTVSAWLDTAPRGQLTYNWTHFQDEQTAIMGPVSFLVRPQVAQAGAFTLTQPLTGFYALLQKARLEGLKKDMAQNSVQFSETMVAFAIAELYIRTQQATAMYSRSQNRIAAGEAIQKEGQALLRAGKIHKGDALKLELVLLEAKSSAAKIKAQFDILEATLKEHTGLRQTQSLVLPPIEVTTPPPVPAATLAIEKALIHRIEFQQAKKGADIAGLGKQFAFAAHLPQLNAFMQWSRDYGQVAFGQETFTRTYGIAATWDIWDNGSRIYKTRAAAEAVLEANYEVEDQQRKIKLEVLEALANLQAASETLTLAKSALLQATEAHRIENSRFLAGSSRASELVLSEAAETGAESNWIAARTEIQSQQYKLERVQGATVPTVL